MNEESLQRANALQKMLKTAQADFAAWENAPQPWANIAPTFPSVAIQGLHHIEHIPLLAYAEFRLACMAHLRKCIDTLEAEFTRL